MFLAKLYTGNNNRKISFGEFFIDICFSVCRILKKNLCIFSLQLWMNVYNIITFFVNA